MNQQPPKQEFQVGFAMAGAISAGAYSAGVLDFFVQALDAWERAKTQTENCDAIPNHRVGIKVFSGASAGAITGALGVIACAGGLNAQDFTRPEAGKQRIKCVLPSLYDAWVVRPCMVAEAGGSDLLQIDDLAKGNVLSLLDSTILDQIEEAALQIKPRTGPELPYLSSTLHVYMTLTNLRGVPYSVRFEGGDYHMLSHGDRVHYRIKGAGSWDTTSPFADKDTCRTLDVRDLWGGNGPSKLWQDYTLAAVASGAFPLGLSPRLIGAALPEYEDRRWPLNEARLGSDCTSLLGRCPGAMTRSGVSNFSPWMVGSSTTSRSNMRASRC